ncbi:MAG: DUF2271 domain-containing protein [Rectinemataceae bacterium]
MKQLDAVRRTIALLIASLLAVAILASCANKPIPSTTTRIQGSRFSLHLVPGPAYKFVSWANVFPVTIYPQVACWIETPQGGYIDTIYVTAKGSRKNWVFAPRGGRPEALPVWFHLQEGKTAAADAVTGATPAGTTMRESALAAALPKGSYVVKLEINRSYDYNERYTRANSGVTGQPSLIYECPIAIGEGTAKAVFKPIGTGAVDGSDGTVRLGLEGITTALQLLDGADISYEAGV